MDTLTNIVTLTDSAAAELRSIRETVELKKKFLRVGVKGGGCSGLTYVLDFDEKKELDQEFDIKGVPVIVDPRHAMYLMGIEVDYQDGLNDRGFIFNNPNASETCGCGTSFST